MKSPLAIIAFLSIHWLLHKINHIEKLHFLITRISIITAIPLVINFYYLQSNCWLSYWNLIIAQNDNFVSYPNIWINVNELSFFYGMLRLCPLLRSVKKRTQNIRNGITMWVQKHLRIESCRKKKIGRKRKFGWLTWMQFFFFRACSHSIIHLVICCHQRKNVKILIILLCSVFQKLQK